MQSIQKLEKKSKLESNLIHRIASGIGKISIMKANLHQIEHNQENFQKTNR